MVADNYQKIGVKESDYLYIQDSQIPLAGNGLYTSITIYKDEVIAIFKGEVITERQIQHRMNRNKDKYFISMLNGKIMDSMKVHSFAKYANDARGGSNSIFRNNAKITTDESHLIYLIATRNIKAGEEIFCPYGKRYWAKHS